MVEAMRLVPEARLAAIPVFYDDRQNAAVLGSLSPSAGKPARVVLYQAGADPHVADPLGGILTTEQPSRRDEIVFGGLKALGIPVAWNLAGGYQTPLRRVLDLHDATMAACVAAYIG